MGKRFKRIIAFAMSFVLVLQVCVLNNISNAYATNRTQNDAVSWAQSQVGKALDYDKMYGCQCVDLIKYYYDYFGAGSYAHGNACEYAVNDLPSGWSRVYSNFQPGDVAVWKTNHSCNTCKTGANGHVGIITSIDSVGFNAVNQNFNSKVDGESTCTQNWFYVSALQCAIRPVYNGGANSADQPQCDTSGWTASASEISETNAKLTARLTLPSKTQFLWAGCNLFDANGNLVAQMGENTSVNNTYINIWYNIHDESNNHYSLKPGTTYKYQFYVNYGGSDHFSPMYSFGSGGTTQKPATTQKATTTQKTTTTQVATTTQSVPTSSISKAERRGETIYLSWTQPSDVSGYAIYYSKNSDMGNSKCLLWSNAEIKMTHEYGDGIVDCDGYISLTDPNSAYYITICSYREINGTKKYSSKSSPIKVDPFDESKLAVDSTTEYKTEVTTEKTPTITPTTEKTVSTTEKPNYYSDDDYEYEDEYYIDIPDIYSFKSKKKGQATVKWYPESSSVDGYQISYSSKWIFNDSEDFKNAKRINIQSRYAGSKTIKGLKKGTRYYIHVRGYKKIDGVKKYGEWGDIWTCKIRKK